MYIHFSDPSADRLFIFYFKAKLWKCQQKLKINGIKYSIIVYYLSRFSPETQFFKVFISLTLMATETISLDFVFLDTLPVIYVVDIRTKLKSGISLGQTSEDT